MAEELQGLWTAKGLEKLATHAAGGAALVIEKLALGDGGGSVPTPQASWTALTQEVWRGDINGVDTVDDNPSQVQVDVIIPFSTGGFFIREWGLYDEDGDLIAVGAHAEFYKPVLSSGAAAELTERILLPMANSGAITLSIPTQAMATQDYVQSQIGDHNEDEEAHPDLLDGLDGLGDEIEALDIALGNHENICATEGIDGHLSLATEALALAGVDNTTAMTPALVKTALDNIDVGTIPIGLVSCVATSTIPAGWLRYGTGTTLTGCDEAYPDFYEYVADSGNTCTLSEYEATLALTGQCGKFGLDEEAGTVRMPTVKFVQNAQSSDVVGTVNQAGLPNIIGSAESLTRNQGTGALYGRQNLSLYEGQSGYFDYLTSGGFGRAGYLEFDASDSSDIYGNSETVQPDSVSHFYIIHAYNTAVSASMAQAAEFTQLLEGKTSTDLGNVTAAGAVTAFRWGVPDFSAGVGLIESEDPQTVPSDGFIYWVADAEEDAAQHFYINDTETGFSKSGSSESTGGSSALIPVRSGDTYYCEGAISRHWLYFYPIKGVANV